MQVALRIGGPSLYLFTQFTSHVIVCFLSLILYILYVYTKKIKHVAIPTSLYVSRTGLKKKGPGKRQKKKKEKRVNIIKNKQMNLINVVCGYAGSAELTYSTFSLH